MMNIRGLLPRTVPSKVPYIRDLLYNTSQLFFALTETWLDDHNEAELHIPGYSLYHQDCIRKRSKNGRSTGGVALYIRDDHAITCEEVFSYSDGGVIDAIGVHIKTLNLFVYVVYRQPDDKVRNHRSTSTELARLLKKLHEQFKSHQSPQPDVILLGDINLPHADWLSGDCTSGASTDEQAMVKSLYDLTLEYFMVQQIDCPTNADGNTIDLVFTNNSDLVHSFTSLPQITRSDHYLIEISAVYKSSGHAEDDDVPKDTKETSFFNLNFFSEDVDWHKLNNELSQHNWEGEFKGLDSTSMLNKFLSVCLSIAKNHVPLKKKVIGNLRQPNRIPKDRRKLMRTRTRIKRQVLRAKSDSKTQALTRRLIEIEKKIQSSQLQQAEYEESKAVENIKRNPKFFFSYAKRFSKIKIGIGPLINSAKTLLTSAKQMSELLSEQYRSVFSIPKHPQLRPNELFPDEPAQESIHNICFSDEDMSSAMNELSNNSAAGPDGFPSILLKSCRQALAPPLANIWRNSMNEGSIPKLCKTANIVPIHKGKSRALPQNYRPIALTSQLIKVFEKVVRRHLVLFMERHDLFNPTQHGFRGGRSCLSQLLCHIDRVTKLLEEGKSVDCVYLDFSKAFDKVDIGITRDLSTRDEQII